jgi:hypothetical protein
VKRNRKNNEKEQRKWKKSTIQKRRTQSRRERIDYKARKKKNNG